MEFEKYTERARGFIQSAQALALKSNHQQLTPLHVLKTRLEDSEGLAANLIDAAGGSSALAFEAVDAQLQGLPKVEGSGAGQIYLPPETAQLFEQAEQLAEKAGDSYVTAEMLLLALAMMTSSSVAKMLAETGVSPQNLNRAINDHRKGRTANTATAEDSYDSLKKYARDLTEDAAEGRIDPVIGRDDEIRRTLQVLSASSEVMYRKI